MKVNVSQCDLSNESRCQCDLGNVNVNLAMEVGQCDWQWKSANLTLAMEVSQCDPHNGSEST